MMLTVVDDKAARKRLPVQRQILATLAHMPYLSTRELINTIYRGHPQTPALITGSQRAAVLRALRNLVTKGLVRQSLYPASTGDSTWELAVLSADQARRRSR